MTLVNPDQIYQDLEKSLPPVPVNFLDTCKMAGSTTALSNLGLLPTPDQEKIAIWSKLIAPAGKALWGATKGLWGGTGGALAKGVGGAASRGVGRLGTRLGASPATISKIQGLGKGMAGQAVGFGAFEGGLGALTAEPGQRGEGFLRGFGQGALTGAVWGGASNLARAGTRRALGQGGKRFDRVEALSTSKKAPWHKRWGAKAVVGGVPLAAGMGATWNMPQVFHGNQQQQQQPAHSAYGRLGAGVTMPHIMGAYPRGSRYNPNLPLPQ